MKSINVDQIEFWNGRHGLVWANNADAVDFIFSDITKALMHASSIRPGDRVIDLGCGSGGTILQIADRVGPSGSVLAVDVSAPMIEQAQKRANRLNYENISFLEKDAEIPPFSTEKFDGLISRFGCMFFDKPRIAFRNIRAALNKGSQLSLAVWRTPRENPWAMEPISVARQYLDMPPRPGPEDPGPFSFSDPDRVRQILPVRSWTDIDIIPLDMELPLGRSDEEAMTFLTQMGPLSIPLAVASTKNYENVLEEIMKLLDQNRDRDGVVRFGAGCWIITGCAD